MKKWVWIFLLTLNVPFMSKAQAFEAEQLLLDVQKLAQLKQMLADLKTGYEIVYKGYATIKDISEGNFSLHEAFLDRLLQVSPAVRTYHKVVAIISLQLKMVSEYKAAFNRFKQSGTFTAGEIDCMRSVYRNLFDQSVKNLQTLAMVVTSGILRMSDDERLQQIDALHEAMVSKLGFLRQFNNQTAVLALQRARDQQDINSSKGIFGLTN